MSVCESVECVIRITKLAVSLERIIIFTRNSTVSFVALNNPRFFCINNYIYGKNGNSV